MPGIHHVMARAIKDIFCRYKTLQGFQVHRKGGWDTHGLPVELQVEKALGIKKDDIGKTISVEDYNAACRKDVLKYKDVWDDLTRKMGYWVDLENPYVTFENDYIESVWNLLQRLHEKDLLYKGFSIQPYSPAAGTGLSSHELNQPGCYRDVKDTTCVAMFQWKGTENDAAKSYFLAWTTTPWTLPANTALAVGANIVYDDIETLNPYTFECVRVVLAHNLAHKFFKAEGENADFEAYLALSEADRRKQPLPWKYHGNYKGKELVGTEYHPLFEEIALVKDFETANPLAFRVIAGDFVSTEDGTGIVHISPTFGADDNRVAQQAGISGLFATDDNGNLSPIVDRQGKYVPAMEQWANRWVKTEYSPTPEDRPLDVDLAIWLKERGRAFQIEKYVHSYPHCWRTDKPVLYYPLDSWFVRTTAAKDRLVELNKTINWKPASTGSGRFGNWLENLVDWNLSRSRYWGIPLPIWRTEDGKEELCIGSVAQLSTEIEKAIKAGVYPSTSEILPYLQALHMSQGANALKTVLLNQTDVIEAMWREDLGFITFVYGTEGDAERAYKGGSGLSHIIAKRTAEGEDGLAIEMVEVIAKGEIIREAPAKDTVNIQYNEYEAVLSKSRFGERETWLLTGWKINKPDASGEVSTQSGATQLNPTFSRDKLGAGLLSAKIQQVLDLHKFDLHKPYADNITLVSPSGKPMRRESDLIDVWFDSGAMPYAQWHFPFENEDAFKANFPADFIAEGVDQTRGWFYTLHAISVLLFDSVAFKNVIANGLVLDKNGNKMSKRLGNAIDPFETISTYGADATRWYMVGSSNPWDNLAFDIEGVKVSRNRFFSTLYNTYSFFATYANIDGWQVGDYAEQIEQNRTELDRWILSVLHTLIGEVQGAMDDFDATRAIRAVDYFLTEQVSNWFVRLSRRRFWKGEMNAEKAAAYATLHEVLEKVAVLMSPFAPFYAEKLYRDLTGSDSVHLAAYPVADSRMIDAHLERKMDLAQRVTSLILSIRSKHQLKIRQPLQKALVAALDEETKRNLDEVAHLIQAETNVKAIEYLTSESNLLVKTAKPNFKAIGQNPALRPFMQQLKAALADISAEQIAQLEATGSLAIGDWTLTQAEIELHTHDIPGWAIATEAGQTVALDIEINEELIQEGIAREFVNRIQNLRKSNGFEVTDRVSIRIADQDAWRVALTQFAPYIQSETLANELLLIPNLTEGEDVEVYDVTAKIAVIRV
jgi:isoleucyl-tRNA synthetase